MLDWSDHRIIALTVCLGIVLVSIIAILIRFFVHRKKKSKLEGVMGEKTE